MCFFPKMLVLLLTLGAPVQLENVWSKRQIKAALSKQISTRPSIITDRPPLPLTVHAAPVTYHFLSAGSASPLPWSAGLLSIPAAATFFINTALGQVLKDPWILNLQAKMNSLSAGSQI